MSAILLSDHEPRDATRALIDDRMTAARLKPRSELKSRDPVDVKFEHVGENVDAADTEAVYGPQWTE